MLMGVKRPTAAWVKIQDTMTMASELLGPFGRCLLVLTFETKPGTVGDITCLP